MSNEPLLTIALATVPATLAVLVGILVNNALLNNFRKHLDFRFDELEERWRSQDLKR